jgi:gluconolactonase
LKRVLIILLAALLVQCDEPRAPFRTKPPAMPDGIVAENATWEILKEDFVYSDGPVTDLAGNFYYADVIARTIFKIDAQGNTTLFDDDTAMTMGMVISDENIMYGCRNLDAQIVRYDWDGTYEVLAEGTLTPRDVMPNGFIPGEYCNDLAVNSDRGVWFTDRVNRKVWYVNPDGDARVVAKGFRPASLHLSLDRKKLFVGDSESPDMHAFTIGENGSLSEIPEFFEPMVLWLKKDAERIRPGTNGMTMDTEGRLYVPTFFGIQVFDANGVLLGMFKNPKGGFVSNLNLGGPDGQWLYATGRGVLSRIRMDTQGITWWKDSVDGAVD